MAKRKPTVGGLGSLVNHNNTVNVKGCCPDHFLSTANKVQMDCQSLLQANAQARLCEKDAERNGEICWNPEVWKVRNRYRKEVVDAGFATHEKSKNNIY